MSDNENKVEGKEYDTPLIITEPMEIEPQRYVAEKPYDLTRYEYSYLKRSLTGSFMCNIFAGATAGIFISVIGKSIVALVNKENPELEIWEIVCFIVGLIVSLLFKYVVKSEDDKVKIELHKVIDTHFNESLPRRIHLTGKENNDEA